MHISTEQIIFHRLWDYFAVIFFHDTEANKKNMEEPSLDQTEEVDAVEAFQTCHTSSKHGLSEPAREALVSAKTRCLLVAI